MKKILITGANGFLGYNCLRVLQHRKFEIYALARNIPQEQNQKINWIEADLFNNTQVTEIIKNIGAEYLLHLAWNMDTGMQLDSELHYGWVETSMHLIKTFYKNGGKRIIVSGTCAEYHWSDQIYFEDTTPLKPTSIYGLCKNQLYQRISSFCKQSNLSFAWARIFFMFGPNENENRLVPYVINSITNGEIVQTTHGNQVFDYLYVEDVVNAMVALIDNKFSGAVNICSGIPIQLKDFISKIAIQLDAIHLIQLGAKEDDKNTPNFVVGSNNRLKEITNWQQKISIDEGIKRTISSVRKQKTFLMENIYILGAGMAGFGAAHHFHKNDIKTTIFEKHDYHGGHAASFKEDGFIFDDGPHISFTKNKRIRRLFDESVHFNLESFKSKINNYWKGYWIKHPAQVNLFGLPKDLIVKIISEIVELQRMTKSDISNYKEWLYATFGKTFSDYFPIKYSNKFHTTSADNLDIDWFGSRFYKPSLNEVLTGAISSDTENIHYVKDFYYPSEGGFVSFLDQFLDISKLEKSHEVTNIDPIQKQITFNSTRIENYDYLISSIPLPELIPLITGAPKEVLEASQKLAFTTCLSINLGINRTNISEAHWTYFYDSDIIFSRLSFPHMQSKNNAPANCGSIQAEIYFSNKYKPLNNDPDYYIETTISDLKRCGILKDDDEIIYKGAKVSPYANIIFDLERIPNLSIVHNYLDQIGINYCGRYGEWGYHWTDDSFISGEKAAQNVIKQIKLKI